MEFTESNVSKREVMTVSFNESYGFHSNSESISTRRVATTEEVYYSVCQQASSNPVTRMTANDAYNISYLGRNEQATGKFPTQFLQDGVQYTVGMVYTDLHASYYLSIYYRTTGD